MATKDTGIEEMHEEEDGAQSNGLGVAVETAGAETPVSDPVTADTSTTGPADADHALISPTGKEPHKEAPTYSEECVNQLKAQHERDRQSRENQLREVENELKERNADTAMQWRWRGVTKKVVALGPLSRVSYAVP